MKTNRQVLVRIKAYTLGVCVGLSGLAASPLASAEKIIIPLGQQGKAWNIDSPRTGMSKEQVEAHFGTPTDARGPVGDPPIYTWEYPDFRVYFEGNHVIHSVVKHSSQR